MMQCDLVNGETKNSSVLSVILSVKEIMGFISLSPLSCGMELWRRHLCHPDSDFCGVIQITFILKFQ
jgi:hypothetical protein